MCFIKERKKEKKQLSAGGSLLQSKKTVHKTSQINVKNAIPNKWSRNNGLKYLTPAPMTATLLAGKSESTHS